MNYEALGRYTEAKAEAEKMLHERNDALRSLASLIHAPLIIGDLGFYAANVTLMKELIDRVARAEHELTLAVARANASAVLCGQETLLLRKA